MVLPEDLYTISATDMQLFTVYCTYIRLFLGAEAICVDSMVIPCVSDVWVCNSEEKLFGTTTRRHLFPTSA